MIAMEFDQDGLVGGGNRTLRIENVHGRVRLSITTIPRQSAPTGQVPATGILLTEEAGVKTDLLIPSIN